jgi:hypothetical protein
MNIKVEEGAQPLALARPSGMSLVPALLSGAASSSSLLPFKCAHRVIECARSIRCFVPAVWII